MICGACKGEHPSAAEVRKCYEAKYEKTFEDKPKPPVPAGLENHLDVGQTRETTKAWGTLEGYYTVVFDEEKDDRITLRIRPHWDTEEAKKGTLVADYLSGPENDRDYTGFAFVAFKGHDKMQPNITHYQPFVWKRFRENGRLTRALDVVMSSPGEAGMAFALESGRCWRCGHTLTVPASIYRGLGPVCAKNMGM
jgi:hypothetical protein